MAGLSVGYNSLLKKTSSGVPAPGVATPAGYDPVASSVNWFQRTSDASTPAAGPVLSGWPGPSETEAQKSARVAANSQLSAQWQLDEQAAKNAADARRADEAFQREMADRARLDASLAAEDAKQREGALRVSGGGSGATYGGAGAAGGGGLSLPQIQELMETLGVTPGTGQQSTTTAPVPAPAAPARIEAPAAPDTRGAESATWARAKDVIGRQTAGALKSLKELQAARGFGSESGVYAAEEGDLLSEGLRSLGDVSRTQAEDALAAERARASEAYQGAVAQRGQDIGVLGTGFSGAISQRGQDLQQYLAQLGLLPSFLSLLQRAAY